MLDEGQRPRAIYSHRSIEIKKEMDQQRSKKIEVRKGEGDKDLVESNLKQIGGHD